MKKDRNTFFESSQVTSSYTPNMMPQMNMGYNPSMMPMPYQAASNTSSFYAGGAPLNTYPSNQAITSTDYDAKISRIERQIQKLEARVSKLENTNFTSNANDDVNITSNMYMI